MKKERTEKEMQEMDEPGVAPINRMIRHSQVRVRWRAGEKEECRMQKASADPRKDLKR